MSVRSCPAMSRRKAAGSSRRAVSRSALASRSEFGRPAGRERVGVGGQTLQRGLDQGDRGSDRGSHRSLPLATAHPARPGLAAGETNVRSGLGFTRAGRNRGRLPLAEACRHGGTDHRLSHAANAASSMSLAASASTIPGRLILGRVQVPAVQPQEHTRHHERCAFVAIDERVVLRDAVRVGCGKAERAPAELAGRDLPRASERGMQSSQTGSLTSRARPGSSGSGQRTPGQFPCRSCEYRPPCGS